MQIFGDNITDGIFGSMRSRSKRRNKNKPGGGAIDEEVWLAAGWKEEKGGLLVTRKPEANPSMTYHEDSIVRFEDTTACMPCAIAFF